MAQLSSVQREPSMEEILASIRRIIEDSDLPKPSATATPTVEPRADVAPAFDKPTFQEFEAYSRAPEEVEPTIVPPAANEDRPDAAVDFVREPVAAALNTAEKHTESDPVSSEIAASVEMLDWSLGVTDEAVINQLSEADFDLAEVADAVLKELSDEQAAEARSVAFEVPSASIEAAEETPSPRAAVDAPSAVFFDEPAAALDAPEDVLDVTEIVSDIPSVTIENAAGAQAPVAEAASSVVTEEQAIETLVSAAMDEPPTAAIEQVAVALALADKSEQQRAAIISEQAGRQVTASFSELAEAFATRGRKGLDEVAEELMRPMLQDWLDNNLPTMVERLVREEIARVARGADA